MTTTQKTIGVVIIAVAIVATALAMFFWETHPLFGASPSGATGRTALQYSVLGVNLAAPGANATSTSVQNNSGQDLYITAIKAGCEGVGTSKTAYTGAGLAAVTVSVATSSTAAPASNGNTNTVGGGAFTLATASPQFVDATNTASGGLGNVYNVWLAGSYMTFTVNATNTAVCTFGVDATSA